MPEMKTLGGYEVVDAKAREEIEGLRNEGHALKSELPTKVSQLQNDSKFITRDEVPEQDLSEYITENELLAKGYLTEHQDISHLAPKTSIPTKVSELANDAGYVTAEDIPENIDTSNLLKYTTVDNQYNWYVATTNKHQVIQNDIPVENMDADLDRAVNGKTLNNNTIAVREGLQLRVPENPTKDTHAASKKYVDNKIAAIPQPDLTPYAKKTELPTKVSELANDKNYLTSIPSEYITESELNAKGYLTEHQSLEAYATKSYVNSSVAECKDVYYLDFSNATEADQVADAQMSDFSEKFQRQRKRDVSVMMKVASSPYFWPAIIQDNTDTIVLSPIAFNPNAVSNIAWDVIRLEKVWEGMDYVWKYSLVISDTVALATEKYVQDAIAALRAELTGGNT